MVDALIEEAGDRLIIRLEPGGPVEIDGLGDSFSALARIYERHYRDKNADPAPKLYVTRLDSGSIEAEIVPLVQFVTHLVATMDASIIIGDFARRLRNGIWAFAGVSHGEAKGDDVREDAADLRAFVLPLTGKRGAELGIIHAKLEKRDGDKHIVAEYSFDETMLNRAAINIEKEIVKKPPPSLSTAQEGGPILTEVMLVFEQASRKPGKQTGRTGDRAIVPDVCDKPLPVYFIKSAQGLKDKMVRSDINPLTDRAFVVDVHVLRLNGEPRAYLVTELHDVIPLDRPSDA